MIDSLWGEAPPAGVVNVLHTHVKHLRRQLEPDRPPRSPSAVLPSVGDGYALRLADATVDFQRFRDLTAAARDAAAHGDPHRAADLLGSALALWQGRPAADVAPLATHPRVLRLVNEQRDAVSRYADAMIDTHRASDVLGLLAEEAAAHPLDEEVQARLIRAYAAVGQRSRALATYETARRHLAEELGVDPGPILVQARRGLLRNAPTRPAAPAARPGSQLPPEPTVFAGRSTEIAELDRVLAADSDEPAAVVGLICGTAGVGKTALALRWAHRRRDRFPDGQLFVDLRGYDPERTLSPAAALRRLLAGLGVNGADLPADVDDLIARYRAETSDRRMLIVLDNAGSAEQVRPLLPGTAPSRVLVTSRDSLAGLVALNGAHRVAVDPMPATDAELLLRRLIGLRAEHDPVSTGALAEQCARLPLALRVAAEFASASPGLTLADLVAELADRRRRLDVLDSGGDVRAAVRTVFSWSYHHLDPDAARAFRRLGLHPGQSFDAAAVAALAGVGRADGVRLVNTLVRANLAHRLRHGRYGLHDLLQAYAAELAQRTDSEATLRAAAERLLSYYVTGSWQAVRALYPTWRGYGQRPPSPDPAEVSLDAADARRWLDAELPALAGLGPFAERHGGSEQAVRIALNLHRYLEGGHYTEALAIQTTALQLARQCDDVSAQAHTLTNLGVIHRLLGRYARAAEYHRRALALHRATGDRSGQARTLSNLGILAERQGDYPGAGRFHNEALCAFRDVGDRFGEAAALANVGNVHIHQGHPAAAIAGFTAALALFRELDDRVGQAIALSNLGDVHIGTGAYPTAAGHLDEALALFRELDHRGGEATVLANLGLLRARTGDPVGGIEYLETALATFRSTGHRYGQASVHNGLGEANRAAGRPDESLAHYREALAVATDTGDHDERVRAENGIAAAGG
jgi:tetratricopeptide (TPR) repeat protein